MIAVISNIAISLSYNFYFTTLFEQIGAYIRGIVTFLRVRGPNLLKPFQALFVSKIGRAQIYFYYCLA